MSRPDHARQRPARAVPRAAPGGRWSVWCRKHDGRAVVFASYGSEREAEVVARRLREVGCDALVRGPGEGAR